MSASLRICRRCASAARLQQSVSHSSMQTRCLHTTLIRHANPLPVTGAGPPPSAPQPAASTASERVARKRAQAELLKQAKEIRASQSGSSTGKPGAGSSPLKRRFWKDVVVQKQADGQHTIHLDKRAVRTPVTKTDLPIPASKPHLATAIALEWDVMTSAQQALKTHNIPLTSMASRAIDIELQDEEARRASSGDGTGVVRKSTKQAAAETGSMSKARDEVVQLLLRYLETDTLLCWAPEKASSEADHDAEAPGYLQQESLDSNSSSSSASSSNSSSSRGRESLRQRQVRTAQEIIAHLTSTVWPGVVIKPVLEEDSILPVPQPAETQAVIRGWLSGLGPWELAGLERAVLATKSLCVATRLLVDWAEAFRGSDGPSVAAGAGAEGVEVRKRFGIEEAADACSLELAWQTAMWGEVEDTHDVDREDLRRQLGSVVLLVSGTS